MTEFLTFIFLFLAIIFVVAFLFYTFFAYFWGAPYVPSDSKVVDRIFELLSLSSDQKFIDLGCGDGKILIAAAEKKLKASGVEINPFWFLFCQMKLVSHNLLSKVRVQLGDYFSTDISQADGLYVFAFPQTIAKTEQFLKDKAKKGAKIVSYKFPLRSWTPALVDEKNKLFLYQKE